MLVLKRFLTAANVIDILQVSLAVNDGVKTLVQSPFLPDRNAIACDKRALR